MKPIFALLSVTLLPLLLSCELEIYASQSQAERVKGPFFTEVAIRTDPSDSTLRLQVTVYPEKFHDGIQEAYLVSAGFVLDDGDYLEMELDSAVNLGWYLSKKVNYPKWFPANPDPAKLPEVTFTAENVFGKRSSYTCKIPPAGVGYFEQGGELVINKWFNP